MFDLLVKCNENLNVLPCCHPAQDMCYCYNCLKKDYWERPDSYECVKKMSFYILNYGPSYASEIYHYLSYSQVLKGLTLNSKIRVLSLGCGFAPDLFAISKYVQNNSLPIQIEYCGIDQSESWIPFRCPFDNATFIEGDAIAKMDFTGYDLVFISKLFSTLYKNGLHNNFLSVFHGAVTNQMQLGRIVVFHDINSVHMGRDVFHNSVNGLFQTCRQFYCDSPPYTRPEWIKIPHDEVVFPIPPGLKYSPLQETTKAVFFEYRK